MQCQPGRGAFGNVPVEYPWVDVFNQVDVLNSNAIARAHYSTCISGLIHIFQNQANMPGSRFKHVIEATHAFIAQKGKQSSKPRIHGGHSQGK
jgi:hypothetical protein